MERNKRIFEGAMVSDVDHLWDSVCYLASL